MMPGLISAESIGRDCRTGRGPVAGFLSDCPAAAVSSKNAMRIGPPKKRLCILGRPILVRDFSEVIMQKPLVKLLLRYLVNRGLFENQDTFG